MKVIIRNCRNKQLKNDLTEAVEFYSDKLMHNNLTRNLCVTLNLKSMKDSYGECYPSWFNKQGKARKFTVNINPREEDPLYTLAHEMYHLKQFATGELSNCLTYWKSRRVAEDLPYKNQPWEKQAFSNDFQLYEKYLHFKIKNIKNNINT